MALVSKIYVPTPAQSVAAARGVPVSKVASLHSSIDESTTNNLAAFDTEFILRDDYRRGTGTGTGADSSPHHNLPRNGGRFIVSSHEFSSLFENYSDSIANDDDPNVRSRQIRVIVSKAIQIYETNAKVIHGNPDVPGTELSIRL